MHITHNTSAYITICAIPHELSVQVRQGGEAPSARRGAVWHTTAWLELNIKISSQESTEHKDLIS